MEGGRRCTSQQWSPGASVLLHTVRQMHREAQELGMVASNCKKASIYHQLRTNVLISSYEIGAILGTKQWRISGRVEGAPSGVRRLRRHERIRETLQVRSTIRIKLHNTISPRIRWHIDHGRTSKTWSRSNLPRRWSRTAGIRARRTRKAWRTSTKPHARQIFPNWMMEYLQHPLVRPADTEPSWGTLTNRMLHCSEKRTLRKCRGSNHEAYSCRVAPYV